MIRITDYCESMQNESDAPPGMKPLAPRTTAFAKEVRRFVKQIPYSRKIIDDCEQLVRASGSVGANYVEANDSLGKQDALYHIRICRKEAKESFYWLDMLLEQIPVSLIDECKRLMKECDELIRIFTKISKTMEAQISSK